MTSRAQRWTLALLIAFMLAGLLVVALQSSRARRSADFTIDYSAALLIREGHLKAIYDRQQLGPLMLRLSGNAIDPGLPFDAPLALALPYVPLTFWPLELALDLWQLITVGILFLALWLLERWLPLSPRAAWLGLMAMLAFPATWSLLSEGQSSAMLLLGAVLLIGAWRRDHWLLAGAGGALLAMKPHYVPVYLILLLAARRWKALGGAVSGAVLIGLSPLLAGGIGGMTAMISSALDAGQRAIPYHESLIGMLAPLLPGAWARYAAFAIWGIVLLTLTGVALRWPLTGAVTAETELTQAMAITTAGLLFAPHALPYDMVLLAIPAWLTFALHRDASALKPSIAWIIVGLVVLFDLHASIAPLAPVAIAGVLGWTIVRRRSWSRTAPPAVRAA
jgi:hypothetical protein